MAVCVLALHEYRELMPSRIGVSVPLVADAGGDAGGARAVPFPYTRRRRSSLGIGVVIVAIAAMIAAMPRGVASDGTDAAAQPAIFTRAVLATAAGALALVYLGLPLGALVGVHIRRPRRGAAAGGHDRRQRHARSTTPAARSAAARWRRR